MKIVIDASGGDNAPQAIVQGAVLAIKQKKDIEIILTGDSKKISQFLNNKNSKNIEVVHAPEIIENSDVPTQVFKQKPNSSLAIAYDILKEKRADALISAGSTGAILVGGFTKIGRIKGISRPALAPLLPTKTGGNVLLLDVGANMDAKSINILHFATMGSSYLKSCFNVENPRIALLNVGEEDEKGNELTKESFELLKQQENINFVGNIEARDILSGKYDVVVCDGFSGNIALKAIEGAVSLAMSEVKGAFKGIRGKIAGLLVLRKLKKSKGKLDYNKYGGSPFLGVKSIVIKSHGSSKAETIRNAIFQAYNLHNSNFLEKLKEELETEKI
jgi:glycerol-3-phosphate acyltransferase PlsX